jgi:hypothetical protein
MQGWNLTAAAGLDVLVAAIPAFRAAVLAGIGFHRDHKFRLGLDSPHRVNQVTSILSSQLQAKLAAQFARAQARFIPGWAEVFETRFDRWCGSRIEIRSHLRNTHGKPMAG